MSVKLTQTPNNKLRRHNIQKAIRKFIKNLILPPLVWGAMINGSMVVVILRKVFQYQNCSLRFWVFTTSFLLLCGQTALSYFYGEGKIEKKWHWCHHWAARFSFLYAILFYLFSFYLMRIQKSLDDPAVILVYTSCFGVTIHALYCFAFTSKEIKTFLSASNNSGIYTRYSCYLVYAFAIAIFIGGNYNELHVDINVFALVFAAVVFFMKSQDEIKATQGNSRLKKK